MSADEKPKRAPKNEVAFEVAQDEFDRMCDAFDVEFDENLPGDEKEQFRAAKDLVIRAIQSKAVVVGEDGRPTVSLKYPVGETSAVTFEFPTGATLVALGDKKATNDTTKSWKLLGDFTGQPAALFSKVRTKPDFKILDALVLLFLG